VSMGSIVPTVNARSVTHHQERGRNMLEIGTDAPDFSLTSHRGATVHLADLRGRKRALLVFYPKDDTPGCTAQLCAIRDNFAALAEYDVTPFGINSDTAVEHTAFAEGQHYQFDLLVDEERTVARSYQAATEGSAAPQRTVYIVGRDGTVIFAQRGAPSPGEMIAAVQAANDGPAAGA